MRCFFCYADGEVPRLSKEHLVSRPVAEAFGLDRSATFGRTGSNDSSVTISPLDTLAVKLVCDRCNNGWMNTIEHRMASVAEWSGSRSLPLSPAHLDSLCAWALKTYVPQGPRYANLRSAGSAVITVGRLQIWIVVPLSLFRSAQVKLPRRVRRATVGLQFGALWAMPLVPRLDEIVVNNGEHDSVEIIKRLQAWAETQ